jgi:hypothetical protein
MPLLWEWLCDARKNLILYVILFLAGGPLLAVGVLDGFIDAILAGIVAIFVSSFEIWNEWKYFCAQQRRLKRHPEKDGGLDSLPVNEVAHSDSGPRFTYDLNSETPAFVRGLIALLLVWLLFHTLISIKNYIGAIVIALDITAIACVLCLLFVAYLRAR